MLNVIFIFESIFIFIQKVKRKLLFQQSFILLSLLFCLLFLFFFQLNSFIEHLLQLLQILITKLSGRLPSITKSCIKQLLIFASIINYLQCIFKPLETIILFAYYLAEHGPHWFVLLEEFSEAVNPWIFKVVRMQLIFLWFFVVEWDWVE